MNAVGYICSFEENSYARETELEIQRVHIIEYCSKNNIKLEKIFEEPKDARPDFKPELLSLLKYISKKQTDEVIVFKDEKLADNRIVKEWIKNELKKANSKLTPIINDSDNVIDILVEEHQNSKASKANYIKNKIEVIPSLPEVVNKVMELVQDPKSSANQMAQIISYDPGLASRVLKMVNSAYYGFEKQISSIQHALAILGYSTIRGLLLSASIYRIFTPKNSDEKVFNYNKFWRHSLITAISGQVISKKLFNLKDEEIFSMGLLHDLGKIILEQYDHDNYMKAYNATQNQFDPKEVLENEEKFCAITHPEVAYVLAEHWNLPSSISQVLLKHHYPLIDSPPDTHSLIINLANSFSNIITEEKDFDVHLFDVETLLYLKLDDEDLLELLEEIHLEIDKIGNLDSFFK